jgi:hypothetical protein
MSSRRRFGTADPYNTIVARTKGLHVRRKSVGVVHRSRAILYRQTFIVRFAPNESLSGGRENTHLEVVFGREHLAQFRQLRRLVFDGLGPLVEPRSWQPVEPRHHLVACGSRVHERAQVRGALHLGLGLGRVRVRGPNP